MIDFASLLWFATYGAAILGIGLALRQIFAWSDGTSFAGAFGGYREAPWPRGVQEEEPVRWNVQRLRRPGRASSREAVPGAAVSAGAGSRLDQVCR